MQTLTDSNTTATKLILDQNLGVFTKSENLEGTAGSPAGASSVATYPNGLPCDAGKASGTGAGAAFNDYETYISHTAFKKSGIQEDVQALLRNLKTYWRDFTAEYELFSEELQRFDSRFTHILESGRCSVLQCSLFD